MLTSDPSAEVVDHPPPTAPAVDYPPTPSVQESPSQLSPCPPHIQWQMQMHTMYPHMLPQTVMSTAPSTLPPLTSESPPVTQPQSQQNEDPQYDSAQQLRGQQQQQQQALLQQHMQMQVQMRMMYPQMCPPMSMLMPVNMPAPVPSTPSATSASPAGSQPHSQLAQDGEAGSPQQQQRMAQQQMQMQMMYPYMYPPMMPMPMPSQPSTSLASPPDSRPHSQHNEHQEQDGTQVSPPQQPSETLPHPLPPPQVPVYAPWSTAQQQQQQMLSSAVLTSDALSPGAFLTPVSVMQPPPPPPTAMTAMGYAQGVPTINLGLQVGMASPQKILIYYVPLLFFLLASGLIGLGTLFTPISRDCIRFSRPAHDLVGIDVYTNRFHNHSGFPVSEYARYAPCTAFKRYGCDVLTNQTVSHWMSNVINGMQAPFPGLFALSNVSDAIITSCSRVSEGSDPVPPTPDEASHVLEHSPSSLSNIASRSQWFSIEADLGHQLEPPSDASRREPLANGLDSPYNGAPPRSVNSPATEELPLYLSGHPPDTHLHRTTDHEHVLPFTVGPHLSGHSHPFSTTGLRIDLKSSYPQGMRAAFFSTCTNDRTTINMLNLTAVYGVDLTSLIPANSTGDSSSLTADQLFAATPTFLKTYFFGTEYSTCDEMYLDCVNPLLYILLSPISEIRRCGGGPVTVPSDSSIDTDSVIVIVCDPVPRELDADPDKNGVLSIVAFGHFSINVSMYATSARSPPSPVPVSFGIDASTSLFIASEVFLLLAIILVVIAANLIPVQRFKLRQLRSALEVDASVAMEILYRAQGAFAGAPPTAMPPAPAAAATVTDDGATRQTSASPLYQPVVAMQPMPLGSSLMVVGLQPHTQPLVSPYSEGRYLPQPDSGAAAAGVEGEGGTEEGSVRTETSHSRSGSSNSGVSSYREGRASRSVSAQEEDTASVVAEAVVSPTEVELATVVPTPRAAGGGMEAVVMVASRVSHHSGDDAAAHASTYSAATPLPSVHAGIDEDGGETCVHHSAAPTSVVVPTTAATAATAVSSCSTTRLHASLLSTPPPPLLSAAIAATPSTASTTAAPPPAPPVAAHLAPQDVLPSTDLMLSQTRHVVSPDVLEGSTPSTPRSGPTRSLLQRLRDHILHCSNTFSASASARANLPHSDDVDDDDAAVADWHYVGPEDSPGERTIQLFVTRARNSYRCMRRKHVRVLRSLILYATITVVVALMLIMIWMWCQLSGAFMKYAEKLQLRQGDTLTTSRKVLRGYIAQLVLTLVAALVSLGLAIAIQRQRIW
jgi:hypothetical protein